MLPKSIERLIETISRLPGIGPKTASRLTFYLLSRPEQELEEYGAAFLGLKKDLQICGLCFNFAEADPCLVCASDDRERKKICVVEEVLDLLALERAGYRGLYHVLGGAISPINGIGPEELHIAPLLARVKTNSEQNLEIILATNPSLEGEATAMYIHKQLEKLRDELPTGSHLRVTRIARGLPVGGELEYADEVTLARALEGRNEY